MEWNQFPDRWRIHFVQKLQDEFGLSETEARSKMEAWKAGLPVLSNPGISPAEKPRSGPIRSNGRSGQSKPKSATND